MSYQRAALAEEVADLLKAAVLTITEYRTAGVREKDHDDTVRLAQEVLLNHVEYFRDLADELSSGVDK